MTLGDALLARLDALGISLRTEQGRLRFRAPKGAMTADLLQEIKAREGELLVRLAAGAGQIARLPDRERYELSHAQRRLWILHALDPQSAAYHVPLVSVLEGPLDAAALAAAFGRLERRHESLRSVFPDDAGVPYQRILPPRDTPASIVDVSSAADPEGAARTLVRALVRRPFDLAQGPVYRAEIVKLAPERHVLALVIHHIVADGVSIAVLARELAEIYAATRAARPPRLTPLDIRYCDFAAWQTAYLDSLEAGRHRQYWLERLAGPPPRLDVPADRARPAVALSEGGEEQFTIDRATADRLRRLCRDTGATLFMGLVALVKVLLHRYTGAEDIVIGSPAAGRPHADVASLVGVFINTLVLRDTIRGDLSFRQVLAAVRRTITEALDHDAYPFDRLVDDLDVDRDPGRAPVVDVMLILQNQQTDAFALEGVTASPVAEHTGTSKFDVTFNFHESQGGISVGIEYRTDLFDHARIRRMGAHLLTLLGSVVNDPAERVCRLELVPPDERRRLLHDWNQTSRPWPHHRSVVDLVADRVRSAPGRAAVACENARLSYGELDRRSSSVAARLRCEGAGPGTVVAACLDRSADLVVGLLGILKSGAAYLPLDPGYPTERLAFLMRDSGARWVLTQRSLEDAAPAGGVTRVFVEEAAEGDGAEAADALSDPDGVAYLIYTSGSTGTPKGVEVTHRNLTNFLLAMTGLVAVQPDDVLLAVTTPTFDIAALELYLPLVAGAQVVVATPEETVDARLLTRRMEKSEPTLMQATPSTWRMLLAAGWRGAPALKVLCGGERLPASLASALAPIAREVWNLYGPTETTIWSLAHRIDPSEVASADLDPPIGRPIANTSAYVFDAGGNLAPQGIPGELCLGGAGVARGYRSRPDLTAERFVPDPHAAAPGARLYRTGDRVVRKEDGALRFLGRDDQQVKVRGFRVELTEVEAALLRNPSVRDAAVLAPEDASGDRLLVAYIVVRRDVPFDASAIRAAVAATLPSYMVPSAIVRLDALPLTPNGKVDRRALPPLGRDLLGTVGCEPPRDDTERAVHAAFAAVLGLETIGIHENFFELGGHSLRATRLAHLLQDALGVDVGLIDVFRAPTIASLAGRLHARPRFADPIQPLMALLTPEERQLLGDV